MFSAIVSPFFPFLYENPLGLWLLTIKQNKKTVTWKCIQAIEQSYSEFHLRPPYLCAVHFHFEGFVSQTRSYFICIPPEPPAVSPCWPTCSWISLQALNRHYRINLALILLCNVAALTCMQLFMKTCVVAVFFKKKRHVRTWYCNRCLYCVNSYVL